MKDQRDKPQGKRPATGRKDAASKNMTSKGLAPKDKRRKDLSVKSGRQDRSGPGSADRPARATEPRTAAKPESYRDRHPAIGKDDRKDATAITRAPLLRRTGTLPAQTVPLILEVEPGENYALLDSGDGRKLEQYGPYRIDRPEGQAIWRPALSESEWCKADAVFTGDTDEEGIGRWRFPRALLGETWPMKHDGIDYLGRFTSFRHVGVFPEQASHWSHMEGLILTAKRPVRVLNLFGYTGLASLVAARAGAQVTHVDASKKAIGWARENQEMARLGDRPIRWICDDAMKFIEREARRDSRYDIILLDPPAYGRGPKGEVWQLFDDLPAMVKLCREILSPRPLAVILTAYSIRASFFATHALVRDAFAGMGGRVESGELVIRERSAGRQLSTSLFSRWVTA